ncbi:unnamed protein product [Cuscuta epithymum]|uniref:Uncharacterized protein n=1 Tax=Cuscuta epithymum TaxID=186058 RepID=A0AAV0G5K8_9ASTE|nr:unnamed protein product [Cuscuta epithymum]
MHMTKSFVEFFLGRVANLTENKLKIFGMNLWSIWQRRNNLLWEGVYETPKQVITIGAELLHAWERARFLHSPGQTRSNSCTRWQAPPHNHAKCNIDAALFEEGKRAGYDACV